MTEENYNYRTSQIMLRNQFAGEGKFQIPIIPKANFADEEFNDLLLIGFDKIKPDDEKHIGRMVHFFLYDYKFERVWNNPEQDLEKLQNYKAVLSPDFSMYREMNPTIQLYNTFRNRWCGAYWADKGLRVIPTVSWGDENTFEFCFKGIPKGSIVAVSTYMVSEHDNRNDQKEFFLKGYREMLRQIEPEKIICYNTPFPEMEGNIIYVDYELSSWKYMSYDRKSTRTEDLEAYKIGGTYDISYDTISPYMVGSTYKGMGSAYGGEWRPSPNKPEDKRFLGEPGEIKTTYRSGYRIDTKIGSNGRAVKERHYTDHKRPHKHSDPHDHMILWDNPTRYPELHKQINYPNGAPEFKQYEGGYSFMGNTIVQANTPEQNRFVSISDFKDCINRGGEVEFDWKFGEYSITWDDDKICITEAYKPETELLCDTADEVLEYMVGGDRLRDVITQVTVLGRTF